MQHAHTHTLHHYNNPALIVTSEPKTLLGLHTNMLRWLLDMNHKSSLIHRWSHTFYFPPLLLWCLVSYVIGAFYISFPVFCIIYSSDFNGQSGTFLIPQWSHVSLWDTLPACATLSSGKWTVEANVCPPAREYQTLCPIRVWGGFISPPPFTSPASGIDCPLHPWAQIMVSIAGWIRERISLNINTFIPGTTLPAV